MKTIVLALAAAFGFAAPAPALANDGAPRGVALEQVNLQIQDVSSRHRRHHRWHRQHRYCDTFWRHGRRVTVCR